MKRKKVFSFFAASAVALSSLAFPAKQAQAQLGGLLSSIPYAGGYINAALNGNLAEYGLSQIPGPGGDIAIHSFRVGTGQEGLLEGVSGILGASLGGTVGGILSTATATARQISGMSYSGNTLTYGEAYQHTWQFRDEDGNVDYVDAKEWKLSYTDGEAKFVLVLTDGREQEYPIEGLYYEEDLRYLCNFLIGRLEELSNIPTEETAVANGETRESLSQNVAILSENLREITSRIDNVISNRDRETARLELQNFFGYINNELCAVSVSLMTIEPGTEPGQIKTLRIRGEMYTFRWCPAGEFTRQAIVGQQTVEKEEWYSRRDRYGRQTRTPRMTTITEDVKGEQRVTLSKGFWILDSEVTQQMYERVTAMRTRRSLSNSQYPSTNVTWSDANKFCKDLNTITKKNFSLPTEAQWQYACLADASSVDLDLVAWYKENSSPYGQSAYGRRYNSRQYSYQQQHDVKTKEPNAWGIYDMQGNVSEWCADWDGAGTSAETAVDPTGPVTGTKRVVCGGNYTSPAENCGFDYAIGQVPNQRGLTIGFRVILIPDPPKEGAETANVNNVPSVDVPSVGGDPDSLTTDADDANQADEDAPAVPEDEVISPDSEEQPETTPETENLNGFESTDENADDASESADAEETGNEAGNAEAGETAETDEPKAPSFADPDDREKLLNALRNANAAQNAAEQAPAEPAQTEGVPAQTEEAPAQVPEAPAQTEEEPDQAPQAPAQTQEAPAQTEEEPDQVPQAPAQTQEAPAQTEEEPDQVPEAPAQTQEAPAQTEEEPDQVPQAPAQAQKAPEQTQKAPVQTQKAPEQVQKAPVQAQKAPEQVQKN